MRAIRLLSTLFLALFAGSTASAQATFVDLAAASGATDLSFGRASAMVDLDGDGLLDLVNANAGQSNTFLKQRPDRTFQVANSLWSVPPETEQSWAVLCADFDNSGAPDVYFINGGRVGQPGIPNVGPNQLLKNEIGTTGAFRDVTALSGAATSSTISFGGTALDYDRDGDLDIFLSNDQNPCTLLRNDGNLVFSDVSTAAGIVTFGNFRHCGNGDIDNDGWLEIGVADKLAGNLLYKNNADGTFTDIAGQAGVRSPGDNFGMVFQDYDNDGWVDIYLAKYQIAPSAPSPLFLNQGDSTFMDVAPSSGMGYHTDMGHDSGDLDSDGYPDIFIGTGAPSSLYPDVLYLITPDGAGGLTATESSMVSGILSSGPSRMHGMAMGDYDQDGDVDIYCNNGGPTWVPTSLQSNFLWANQGNGNGWLALKLTGVLSNRTAAGTRTVTTTSSGRKIHTSLAVGRGFGNTPSPIQHVGLGSESQVDRVDITWPSGITQTLINPPARAEKAVTETGILMSGTPAVGGSVTVDFAGPAFEMVDFNLALVQTSLLLTDIDGVLELGGPITKLLSFPLDAKGRASISFPIPDNPNFAGVTAYLQAWVRPVSISGGTLTNTLAVTIQ